MDRDIRGQQNNELKEGNLFTKKNKEALEISSTGYGYETVQEISGKKNKLNR